MPRRPLVWDMETGDPDDFLTLLLLLDHPDVELRAVCITPGTPQQVGLVRRALDWFGRRDLPVGAFNLAHPKVCVSSWHLQFGELTASTDAVSGAELMLDVLDASVTLVTGGPNKNLGAAMALADARGTQLKADRWVAQGGFAGEGVVPRERQLAKFTGLVTCPTYNLNGDPKAVLRALNEPGLRSRRFVSKNVCHGVRYDAAMHEQFAAVRARRQSLEIIWKSMESYLRHNPGGKAMHDPLAACCAIDEAVGEWARVELYRVRGEWGARLEPGSSTEIIVGYDPERFVATMLR